jgi:hypothetical protein
LVLMSFFCEFVSHHMTVKSLLEIMFPNVLGDVKWYTLWLWLT